jgi:hypothetical protein
MGSIPVPQRLSFAQKCGAFVASTVRFYLEPQVNTAVSRVALWTVVIVAGLLICAACPAVSAAIIERTRGEHFVQSVATHANDLQSWLEFAEFSADLLLFVLFGEAIFFQGGKRWIERFFDAFQQLAEKLTRNALEEFALASQSAVVDAISALQGAPWRNTLSRLRVIRHSWGALWRPMLPAPYLHLPEYTNNLGTLLGVRLLLAFPGGLLGLLAFILFTARFAAVILKGYVVEIARVANT